MTYTNALPATTTSWGRTWHFDSGTASVDLAGRRLFVPVVSCELHPTRHDDVVMIPVGKEVNGMQSYVEIGECLAADIVATFPGVTMGPEVAW